MGCFLTVPVRFRGSTKKKRPLAPRTGGRRRPFAGYQPDRGVIASKNSSIQKKGPLANLTGGPHRPLTVTGKRLCLPSHWMYVYQESLILSILPALHHPDSSESGGSSTKARWVGRWWKKLHRKASTPRNS